MQCEDCGSAIEDYYDLCWSCKKLRDARNNEEVQVAYDRVVHETEKAWKLMIDDSDPFNPKSCWLPKSIAELDTEAKEAWVPRWFADQENLETLDD
jgi:hypothetical protein